MSKVLKDSEQLQWGRRYSKVPSYVTFSISPALLAAYILSFANLAHRVGDYKGEALARYELVVIELLFNYKYLLSLTRPSS